MGRIALTQIGTSLYTVDLSSGTVSSALTLPTGVTLSSSRKPRFATLNQWTAVVNSPTQNIVIDPEGTVRPLTLRPPINGPTTAVSSTGLTGAYKYKVSHVILNNEGELLSESPLSPASVSLTLANEGVALTDIPISLDTITARRVYRTLAGGSLYFHVFDVDGNSNTAFFDNKADATLELLPAGATTLAMPPGALAGIRFKIIVEWKSRLWAVADDPALIDTIYASETNKVYTWPNSAVAYPTGQDKEGIVALVPRRNQLGILKRNGLWQIGGSAGSTGISFNNISISQIVVGKAGCVAPDSVVVVNDKAYWLGKDGVYEWSDEGVVNITNDTVAPWFKTDTYFQRSRFPNAFAKYNEARHSYELHLANTGDSTENRWVSFYLKNRKWYGPHLTGLFTPSHAAHVMDDNGLPMALVGASTGVIYTANSTTIRDGASTAIDYDVYTPFYSAEAPDIMHYWGELSMHSDIESGGTLTVTPYLGGLDAGAGTAISHDLTLGRQRLRRLGNGRLMRLRLRENSANQGVSVYGFECQVHELGRR